MPTNLERIREMSAEEIADEIMVHDCKTCVFEGGLCMGNIKKTCNEGHIAWLNQEAEE